MSTWYEKNANLFRDAQTSMDQKAGSGRMILRRRVMDLQPKRVLDVGCGAGIDVLWLNEHGINAIGADASVAMITLAQEANSTPEQFVVADMQHLPFADASFDCIISRYALQDVKDLNLVFKELHRLLTSNGALLLIVSHPIALCAASQYTEYGTHNRVTVPLFEGKCEVNDILYGFQDYLEKKVLTLFSLTELVEGPSSSSQEHHETPFTHLPEYVFLHMRKRGSENSLLHHQDGWVQFGELRLWVCDGVFSPNADLTHSSAMVIDHIQKNPTCVQGKRVLDMGSGSGVLSVHAARIGAASVVAVDNELRAVANTLFNIQQHNCMHVVHVQHSDLFANVEGEFDCIFANLPIQENGIWGENVNVTATVIQFLRTAKTHLNLGGKILLTWASFTPLDPIRKEMIAQGYTVEEKSEEQFGVTWYLLILTYK